MEGRVVHMDPPLSFMPRIELPQLIFLFVAALVVWAIRSPRDPFSR